LIVLVVVGFCPSHGHLLLRIQKFLLFRVDAAAAALGLPAVQTVAFFGDQTEVFGVE